MAKKKNRPNPPKKNDSSIPYVERLAAERKEKEEQELLSDERVKKKLEEYGFKVKLTHDEGQLGEKDRLEEEQKEAQKPKKKRMTLKSG